MRTFVRCWLIAVLIVASPAVADAACRVAVKRQVIVRKQVAVVAAAVVAPVAVAVAAVPVAGYSAGYGAGYGQQLYGATYQPDGLLEAFKLVLKQNETLISQTQALILQLPGRGGQAGPGVAPPPMGGADGQPPQAPPPVGAGALVDLTPDQNAAVIAKVARGEMPKNGKMSAEERLAFIDAVTGGTEPEVLRAFQFRCAACHDGANFKAKGKGFQLLK